MIIHVNELKTPVKNKIKWRHKLIVKPESFFFFFFEPINQNELNLSTLMPFLSNLNVTYCNDFQCWWIEIAS